MSTDSRSSGSNALEVFADWLARHGQGVLVPFEELVLWHPSLEAELRELHTTWERLAAASEPDTSSLQQRLESRFGKESLSQVSLREREAGETVTDLSAALIAQLSAHGKSFGRYTIRGEVARGGMGAILKIWDEELRRHLAMKVILGQADSRPSGETPPVESSRVARFLEEAQVTGQLDHPGIVPVHELGLDPGGRLYFTMKLVKGESLHTIFEHMREGREDWSQTRALNVLLKVCEAMAYAHDKGVIHRDLKPANVMVGKFGEVHVMDWGLARIEGQKDRKDIRIREDHARTTEMRSVRSDKRGETPDSPLCTMDGDVVGTPAYMPPEQAAGKVEEVGPHSDVYALGAMLYHLLAGHPPHIPRGVRLNNYAVWARVQEGPPIPLAQLAPETPPELLAICDRAMARDWRQRYRDMSEMAGDLSAYLNQRVVRAYETGAWAEARKWVARNRALAASLAAAVLIAIGGSLWVSIVQSQARTDMVTKNTQLAAATKTAQENERKAVVSAAQATEQERIATQKAEDVLSLSALQDLRDLEVRADELWPATPENLPKFEAWLTVARLLVEGRAADPENGTKGRPSLAEHEAKLVELRARARARSTAQIDLDRRADPAFADWEQARAHLTWMRRMLAKEPWPSISEVEKAVLDETLPEDPSALDSIAIPLVDPERTRIVYGDEVRGLVLSRLAVDASSGTDRAHFRLTLSAALYRCGLLDEAVAEADRAGSEVHLAVDEIPGNLDLIDGFVAEMHSHVADWKADGDRALRITEEAILSAEVAELERGLDESRRYEFDDPDEQWWHGMLSSLVIGIRGLTDEREGGLLSTGTSKRYGWGILKRAEFARTIQTRSIEGPEARRLWDEAIAAIEMSPKYAGLRLTPQLGLLPIGPDPESGFWEFAHLQTGTPAVRGSDGRLTVTDEMGLVFVLIPGGTFLMGAQPGGPSGPNFDPGARTLESPVHEVALSPYFFSKFEMTQGQWFRFCGRNPSFYVSGANGGSLIIGLTHPVEEVSWTECTRVMSRLELELPTEAQWEFGCRGGTSTPWWTGDARESLHGKTNIADRAAARGGARWQAIEDWPEFEDGWGVHAPAGTFPPNPFGLHEITGNVQEWCSDGYFLYSVEKQVDPIRPDQAESMHVMRDGSYNQKASDTRSAARACGQPEHMSPYLGLRPARKVTP